MIPFKAPIFGAEGFNCPHCNAYSHQSWFQPGKNINDDIANLVKEGLPPDIQRALGIVRVTGNDAVHPGQMGLKDDVETANRLFELVNLIAQVMITQPKEIKQLYETLLETT